MIRKNLAFLFVLLSITFVFQNCSDDDEAPTTGKIIGKVTDAVSGTALADATVIVFDADANEPLVTGKTNATGDFAFDVAQGTYFLKFYKQGYESIPPKGLSAVPFDVINGQSTEQPAELTASTLTNAGYISGRVTVGSEGKGGVLVVAETSQLGFSSITDANGMYTIYNVPAGSYAVKGYLAGHSTTTEQASVTSGAETSAINLALTFGESYTFSGTFKVISQTNIQVTPTTMDISLVHPLTKETIPGLSFTQSYSSSITFSKMGVPAGRYLVRATFVNDYIVVDPDAIVKFGEPEVEFSAAGQSPASVDIIATSSVSLTSNTNAMTTTQPIEVTAGSIPAFTWAAYPSTSDYVIEVLDATTGQVIWGGFSEDQNGNPVKNIVVPSNTTSLQFNSDGNALAQLQAGRIYRWRVYASKNDQSDLGWNLIAMSEDQQGLFRVN